MPLPHVQNETSWTPGYGVACGTWFSASLEASAWRAAQPSALDMLRTFARGGFIGCHMDGIRDR